MNNKDFSKREKTYTPSVQTLKDRYRILILIYICFILYLLFSFIISLAGDHERGIYIINNSSKELTLVEVMDDGSVKNSEIKPWKEGASWKYGTRFIYVTS